MPHSRGLWQSLVGVEYYLLLQLLIYESIAAAHECEIAALSFNFKAVQVISFKPNVRISLRTFDYLKIMPRL